MKSKWLRSAVLGLAVFIAIVAGSLLLFRNESSELHEVTFDDVVTKIEKGQVRDALFLKAAVEVSDFDGNKYISNIGSETNRERLLAAIGEYNKINHSKPISLTEESYSGRFGWIVLVQAAPFVLFFVFLAVAFGLIVWAVRTLSGNKG